MLPRRPKVERDLGWLGAVEGDRFQSLHLEMSMAEMRDRRVALGSSGGLLNRVSIERGKTVQNLRFTLLLAFETLPIVSGVNF